MKLPGACATRFRFERELASGGFGSVVLAMQVGLDRPVAIKLLHAHVLTEGDGLQRFLLEAQVTAKLEHPHIVRVVDHGVDDGIPWIAYEFLPGRSLADAISLTRLPPAEALTIAAQVAGALGAAHAAGVLHRDVKPANVMEAAKGIWKLTDFGIARYTSGERSQTATGVVLGTPHYLAPDAIRGEKLTRASDQYSLGVMLYELLTGRTPFEGSGYMEVFQQHLHAPPPVPSERVPGLPDAADPIVARMLAKQPGERYPDMAGAQAALERAAARIRGEASAVTAPGGPAGAARRSTGATRPLSGATRLSTRPDVPAAPARGVSPVLLAVGALAAVLGAAWLAVSLRPVPKPLPEPVVVPSPSATPSPRPAPREQVVVPGGLYKLGALQPNPKRDGPVHPVLLSTFKIDRYEVTNAQFAEFVRATGYRTSAEKAGFALGAELLSDKSWRAERVPRLDWRHPRAPDESIDGKDRHPVVQVSWDDAQAYCDWAGAKLPTEAQWEAAARGNRAGLLWAQVAYSGINCFDSWQVEQAKATVMIGSMSGDVVRTDLVEGVYDMVGNVAEWCRDRFRDDAYVRRGSRSDPCEERPNPGETKLVRVTRGSSFHQGISVGAPFARHNARQDLAICSQGFRCVSEGR